MAITAVRKVDQYLEITEDGKTYRMSVGFDDAIVSAIVSGQYKLLNIYYDVATGIFKAVYTDGTTQYTADISAATTDDSLVWALAVGG